MQPSVYTSLFNNNWRFQLRYNYVINKHYISIRTNIYIYIYIHIYIYIVRKKFVTGHSVVTKHFRRCRTLRPNTARKFSCMKTSCIVLLNVTADGGKFWRCLQDGCDGRIKTDAYDAFVKFASGIATILRRRRTSRYALW